MLKRLAILCIPVLLSVQCQQSTTVSTEKSLTSAGYITNRAPLQEPAMIPLTLGSVKPQGWLKEQLKRMADGMTGELDEVYASVVGPRNGWLGGDGDCWERGPYWLDGLLPLAAILNDADLLAKVEPWIEWTLNSQRDDGYFGPVDPPNASKKEPGLQKTNAADWWPRMVVLKVLQTWYEVKHDERVIDLMTKYFRYQLATLPEKPLGHWTYWGKVRGGENLASVYWLYNRTGDAFLLELAELVNNQTADWTSTFEQRLLTIPQRHVQYTRDMDRLLPTMPPDAETLSGTLPPHAYQGFTHVVNLAMAVKQPAVYYLQSGDKRYLDAVEQGLRDLTLYHGQPQGMFAGDEFLHGTEPAQGTELCAIVELMFSLEALTQITGNATYADRLERIAYNALPTQITDDFTRKQYFQQPNQIACIQDDNRRFMNSGDRVTYGLLSGYPCCTCNLHQGWPKFVQHMWMATPDGGLAAAAYGPSEVTAKVAGGVTVHLTEETNYPFTDQITFRLQSDAPVAFPLSLRIPGWCAEATIRINGIEHSVNGATGYVPVERIWNNGDVIELQIPMPIKTSRWHNSAASVEMGPLVYALKIDEQWQKVEGDGRYATWEVLPESPWNYALQLDEKNLQASVTVERRSVSDYPWTLEDAPIQIKMKARRLPFWKAYNGMAGPLPYSPVQSSEPVKEVTLIPYGCSTLRISEFPLLR
jgi:uncharacterized protein